jgi:hypothetical protein
MDQIKLLVRNLPTLMELYKRDSVVRIPSHITRKLLNFITNIH